MKQKEIIARQRLADWTKEIDRFSSIYDYSYSFVATYQIRLVREDIKVDIFPKGMKYFDITNQKWGETDNLEKTIQEFFIGY